MFYSSAYPGDTETVFDDDGMFIMSVDFQKDKMIVWFCGEEHEPMLSDEAIGAEIDDLREYIREEKWGSGAYCADGSGVHISRIENDEVTIYRYFLTSNGYSYEQNSGPGKLCIELFESYRSDKIVYQLHVHKNWLKANIYNLLKGPDQYYANFM